MSNWILDNKFLILSVIVCLAIVFGEVATYKSAFQNYDSEVTAENGVIDYSIYSSGADTFTVTAFDNGNAQALTELYIFMDDDYDAHISEARSLSGVVSSDQQQVIKRIVNSLELRGFTNISVLDADDLAYAMENDLVSGETKGLLMLSYALPGSIYSGSADDLLLRWVDSGMTLYWATSPIGRFYHSDDGLVTVEDNDELFFGKECVNYGDTNYAFTVLEADGLTEALALKWNRVKFALDVSDIPNSMTVGFSEDGYTSISFVGYGAGTICVFGGDYDRDLCDDITQVISSGMTLDSKVIGIESGNITRGNVTGTIPYNDAENITVYVAIGGYYTSYAKTFQRSV